MSKYLIQSNQFLCNIGKLLINYYHYYNLFQEFERKHCVCTHIYVCAWKGRKKDNLWQRGIIFLGEERKWKREWWSQIQISLSCSSANNSIDHSIRCFQKLYTNVKILTNLCYCHPADSRYTHNWPCREFELCSILSLNSFSKHFS